MERSFPDSLDRSVLGFSVTFWTDPDHKWLLQHSTTDPLPCFAQIKGVRTKIEPAFDTQQLFMKCIRCALSNAVPEAKMTEYPSMQIGFAFVSMRVYANVPLSVESLANEATRELRDYLVSVCKSAS